MRLAFTMEILKNESYKFVFVYKLEQSLYFKQNLDVRDVVRILFNEIYSEIEKMNYDIWLFDEEVLIDNLFKIFIFVLCDEKELETVHNILVKEKQIIFADKFELNEFFLTNNIKKIINSHISYYLRKSSLNSIKDYFLLKEVNLFESDYSHYLICELNTNSIEIDKYIKQGCYIYFKLKIFFGIGLLKLKECWEKNSLKKLSKFQLNHIYNKNYLSQLKFIEETNNRFFILDNRSKLKTNLINCTKEILLCYPILNCYRSKIFYPYIIDKIVKQVEEYKNKFSEKKALALLAFNFNSILIDTSDKLFFDQRISLISEEENLKIYDKINNFDEKIKKNRLPFNMTYNDFTSDFDENIFKDHLFCSFYSTLNKYSTLFFISSNDTEIICCDENFKNYIERKILEYFAFFIHYDKHKNEFKYQDYDINLNNIENDYNNFSFVSNNSSYKKSLLKPFNKEEILSQIECITDYGNKKITKKDLKIREEQCKKIITDANKEFFDKLEEEIIHGKYSNKPSKIIFCIPNDRNSILNKFN